LEIRLLGPVEVDSDEGPVKIGHARQRCVLAALAEEPGKVISVDDLIDRVWADAAPPGARQTLQSYVSRLRGAVGRAGEIGLGNRDGGYVLEIEPDLVDLCRFRRLVAEARTISGTGDDNSAADLFAHALGLWRGEPLGGLDGPWVEGVRRRLAEERLAVVEDRLDLDLRLGRHSRVVGELAELVRQHPWRERLVGQLMLALYGSGRQADALAVYRDHKRLLDEDGLYPGPGLQQLELRILRADPALPGNEGPALVGEPRSADPGDDPIRRDLIEEVRRRWIRGGLERSDGYPRHVEVRLAEQPDAVWDSYRPALPRRLAEPEPLPSGTRLVDLFTARFNRRCLILGAAGAGKTTMLLELARDLLAQADDDRSAAVPVVFLLSRWSGRFGGLAD
jgi:DNA-binding SARP family transcriptional activator